MQSAPGGGRRTIQEWLSDTVRHSEEALIFFALKQYPPACRALPIGPGGYGLRPDTERKGPLPCGLKHVLAHDEFLYDVEHAHGYGHTVH